MTNRQTALVENKTGRPVPLQYLFATKDGLDHIFCDPDAGPGASRGLLGLRGDGVKSDPSENVFKKKKKKKKVSIQEVFPWTA